MYSTDTRLFIPWQLRDCGEVSERKMTGCEERDKVGAESDAG